MRRFGYEGFPVVKDGKVVGLLTRRSVDRAISHKLNLPVLRLMDAGEISVSPDDSVEHLHRVVSETGWGQIPVVEPESGKIIGIVTRTDLLKTLAAPAGISQQLNLSDRLESSLPEDRLRLLRMIAQVATEQHSALYIVGGFVRDLLLESPSPDFDLVVEGDAISLAQALAKRYGGRVTSHARFGTAKWHLESAPGRELSPQLTATGLHTVDLITARTEFYSYPTVLPTVERGSIKLDLHRRDFTINTLALRLDGRHYGELHDYWGGLNDLRSGLVRVLHSLSFVDDPTRILRAVRFEQRFGFKIEDRTMDLLMEARPLISRLSGERIRHELNAILTSDQASQILKRMHQLGLLTAIHPYLDWDAWLAARFESLNELRLEAEWEIARRDERTLKRELGYILWLMRLRVDQALDVAARLKMPVDLVRNIQGACGLWAHADELQLEAPGAVVACLEDIPPLARYAFYLATENVQQRQAVRQYVMHWRRIMPTIDGHALRKLGLPPGPNYRTILDALRLAWLEGKVHSSEDEQALLNQLIRQYSK
jgi:tRNA nucleotidyltransferase (CCA-adding enzyme)